MAVETTVAETSATRPGLRQYGSESPARTIDNTYLNFSKDVRHYRTMLEIRHGRRLQSTFFDPQSTVALAIPNVLFDHRMVTPAQPLSVYVGMRAKL
jgi:hypothetical protein